jgi:uncharacterized membrane protein
MATDEADRGASESSTESTASTGKRIATGVLGGTLLAAGIRRRGLGGVATALAGGWLLARGLRANSRSRNPSVRGTTAERPADEAKERTGGTAVEQSITVGRPADELYDLWQDPVRLSRVLGDSVEVAAAGEDRQRWTVEGPLGRSVEWVTETVEDRPGEVLRWESVAGSRLASEGSVHFRPAPGDRGTEVTLRLRFDPPGGRVGDATMNLLGVVPETLAGTALDRLKSLAETGEIPTLDRNPSGRGQGDVV